MRISDWSSDVCSSDLERLPSGLALGGAGVRRGVAAEIELREVDRAHHQRRKAAFPGVVGADSAGEGEQMARHLDTHQTLAHERKSAVSGKREQVGVDLGGSWSIKQNTKRMNTI